MLQITDSHLKASAGATLLGLDTADTLARVLEHTLGQRRPDAIIASGDLAHDPEPGAYQRFRDLMSTFDGPVLYLPGNHDLAQPLRAVLGDDLSLGLPGWEILGFDSHADHRAEAAFDAAARDALYGRIRGSRADHVLLACHHHLLPVGCPWLDKDCIPKGREVLESCAALGRVRGLVFGHVHQEFRAQVGGIEVLGTPSTCFQFEPRSQRFAIDRSEVTGLPGARWLTLYPDGRVHSEVDRLPAFRLNIDLSDRS